MQPDQADPTYYRQASLKIATQLRAIAHSKLIRGLPAYQQQVSIHTRPKAGRYAESRAPLALHDLKAGLSLKSHYHPNPACLPESTAPDDLLAVRAQTGAIFRRQAGLSVRLTQDYQDAYIRSFNHY